MFDLLGLCLSSSWPSETVKISRFKLSKFSFSKLSKFPFPNCQNFLFQTVKISLSKLSKFLFSNCQNFSFQTVKISLSKLSKIPIKTLIKKAPPQHNQFPKKKISSSPKSIHLLCSFKQKPVRCKKSLTLKYLEQKGKHPQKSQWWIFH